jgi:Lipase (class 3)
MSNANSIPNLKQRQIMLSFAYLAYCGELITTASPEQTILGFINLAIPQIPPISPPNDSWAVVWGPAVYTTPGALYQDNLMFLAQNQSDLTQFAVAVRGTNASADLDWLMEDFDIFDLLNWPPGTALSPIGPRTSESTSIGLEVLLGMEGPTANGSQSLLAFLKSQTTNAINVCVTGHSLGGCLAATLALYLKEQRDAWDVSGSSNVSTITFAGPTAGNLAFAAYSDSQFSGGPYPPNWDSSLGTTCDAVRCNLDVAPLAWIASNLSQPATSPSGTYFSPLFAIYAPPNVPGSPNLDFAKLSFTSGLAWTYVLNNAFPALAGIVANADYQQIVANAAPIAGTFQSPIKSTVPPPTDDLVDYIKAFVAEATYQHSISYPTILQVLALLDPSIINKGS